MPRARQLTAQMLGSIRANRAKVVVIDITRVQSVDFRGARTMITLGIDLDRIATVGDLQSAAERTHQLLGYVVDKTKPAPAVD